MLAEGNVHIRYWVIKQLWLEAKVTAVLILTGVVTNGMVTTVETVTHLPSKSTIITPSVGDKKVFVCV